MLKGAAHETDEESFLAVVALVVRPCLKGYGLKPLVVLGLRLKRHPEESQRSEEGLNFADHM